jgi:hypothetical protein
MAAPTATLSGCAAAPVAWSIAPGLPTGAVLGADGAVTWTPTCGQADAYASFTLTATAATGETGTGTFNLTVTHKVGTVTVASIVDQTVAELSPLTVTPGATLTDCAAGPVTWTATGLPATAAIDGATGLVTWTPGCAAFETNGGVYGPVTVTARAGTGETGETAFTIHVTNTPVAVGQVAGLLAATGPAPGGGAGRTGITVHFTAPPEASAIEVYRAPFGNYPEYAAPPNPGSEPAAPTTYPPPAPWALTGVTGNGQVDNPPSRDFWYYVAFARNACGDVSQVSARTAGTLDYRLGDVSNGITLGTGDNVVNTVDMTALGAHYGLSGSVIDAFAFLDVGPTSTGWIDGRPVTDDEINFEDLVIFAINFGQVSFLRAAPKAGSSQVSGADEIALARPEHVVAGTTAVAELRVRGSGALVAVSTALSWDPAVVEPVGQVAGEWLTGQGGVALSPRPGTVDAAVLAGTGMAGEGLLSTVTFRVLASGDPKIRIRAVDGRDAMNQKVAVGSTEESIALVLPTVTQLSPVTPNPFTAGTTIAFSLAHGGPVDLAIYTVTGRRVTTLLRGTHDPGLYQLAWDGRDDAGRAMGAGVYYVHLSAPEGRFTRAITRLR